MLDYKKYALLRRKLIEALSCEHFFEKANESYVKNINMLQIVDTSLMERRCVNRMLTWLSDLVDSLAETAFAL